MDDEAARSAPPATFSREELDAAELERHPSARRRWLLGLAIGALGGMYVGLAGFLNPLVLLCLPFAFTAAGAGALVGAGIVWTAGLLVMGSDVVSSSDPLSAFAWGSSAIVLAIGLVGTWAAARRARDAAA